MEVLKTLLIVFLTLLALYIAARVITLGVMKSYFEFNERRNHYASKKKEKTRNKISKTSASKK